MANDDEGMQMEAPKSGCNRVGSYSYEPNGFKFGDAPFSYSETKIPTRNLWQRNFLIQTDFRTFYPNGILFVAPGTKEKQKHYIMLTLRDGMLTLIIRGRKKQSLHLPVKVNDGQWHRVQLVTFNRTATLSVTLQHKNTHAQQMKIPKKLNASNKLFVGGLPDEAMHLPSELVSKLEGFKGCLRKFSVNNVTQDLAKVNSHKNVGQCFPRVEKGSYFPGDAYGIYKRNFNVGRVLELQLEYKTSELNGILLSVSDRDGFPALSLEMNNGNIVFSTDMGDGIPLRATKSMDSKYALCNNKWHTVYALYDSEQIFVRVDNLTSVYDVTPNRGNKIQTKSPLYIGGIPEQASQGTLLSRENFKGCINNVVIRGDLKDWTDYDHLHNILLNECPATQ
ncbi:laminin subunit alpha-1-like [Culicoides brevitarsis]|uniref:laminin subunit alpha-1-like n=1 Tax=Culicoides brevitarsis TaxID=469753 RepID=UPI00307B1E3D